MTLKAKVNDPYFQYQPRVSHNACLVQIWWFQPKSVTSSRADKVKFTDGRTDAGNDNTPSAWEVKGKNEKSSEYYSILKSNLIDTKNPSFWRSTLIIYCSFGTAVLCAMSRYSGSCYNETRFSVYLVMFNWYIFSFKQWMTLGFFVWDVGCGEWWTERI